MGGSASQGKLLDLASLYVQVPRRRMMGRQRTSQYMGVGSSNRKGVWQARILVHGKVGHDACG